MVPVTNVSRLTRHALSEAISLGDEVMAVTVVFDGVEVGLPDYERGAMWRQWDPGVPLRVLHTDYASIVQPILGLVDELRAERDCQIVVLIPMVVPEHLRYRLLHNQIDLAPGLHSSAAGPTWWWPGCPCRSSTPEHRP